MEDKIRSGLFAFGGLQLATAILLCTETRDVPSRDLVVTLFCVSIPATFVFAGMRAWYAKAICGTAAFPTATIALSILFGSASYKAGAIFLIGCAVWAAAVAVPSKGEAHALGEPTQRPNKPPQPMTRSGPDRRDEADVGARHG